jgi:hypothetical protein
MQKSLDEYFAEHGIAEPSRADTVLALLRINTPEALRAAEVIVGRPISRCPPCIPPWPPKPVQRAPTPRVVRVGDNPHYPSSSPHHRFSQVKVGMTLDQLARRGISRRDIREWVKAEVVAVE